MKPRFFFYLLICFQCLYAQQNTLRFFDGNKTREIFVQKNSVQNGSSEDDSAEKNSAENNSVQGESSAQFFYRTQYYNLRLEQDAVLALQQASQKYSEDFQKRRLKTKSKKTFSKYGTFSARLEWGTTRQDTSHFSNVKIFFGYQFVSGSPYFSISIKDSAAQNEEIRPAFGSSGNVFLYFTKSQLSEFLSSI